MVFEIWQILISLFLWVISAWIAFQIVKRKTLERESIKVIQVLIITLGLRLLIGILIVTISLIAIERVPAL